MRRILMVLSVAALMAAMLVVFAMPAFALDYESDFWKGYSECVLDNNCLMEGVPTIQKSPDPFPVADPADCPAGTTWAPTSDPKYGGAKYVCE